MKMDWKKSMSVARFLVLFVLVAASRSAKAQIEFCTTQKELGRFESNLVPMGGPSATGWTRGAFAYDGSMILESMKKEFEWAGLSELFDRKMEEAQAGTGGFYLTNLKMFLNQENREYLPTGVCRVKIYLKNIENDGVTSASWQELTDQAQLVYDGDPSVALGKDPGYKVFSFSRPFTYTLGKLLVLVETVNKSNVSGNYSWAVEGSSENPWFNGNNAAFERKTVGGQPPANSIFDQGQTDLHPVLKFRAMTSVNDNPVISVGSSGINADDNFNFIRNGPTGWNRNLYIYPLASLDNMPPDANIASLQFLRLGDGPAPAPGNKVRLYLKNTADFSFYGPTSWSQQLQGAVKVFDGDMADVVGTAAGFKNFVFDNSFRYTGDNLELLVEYEKNNNGYEPVYWSSSDHEGEPSYDGQQSMFYVDNSGGGIPVDNVFQDFYPRNLDIRFVLGNDQSLGGGTSAAKTTINGIDLNPSYGGGGDGFRNYMINKDIYNISTQKVNGNKGKTVITKSLDDFFVSTKKSFTTDASVTGGNVVKAFILLHKAVDPTIAQFTQPTPDGATVGNTLEDYFVSGKIIGTRGSRVSGNVKFQVEVNSSSAYNQNKASLISYNNNQEVKNRMVIVKYDKVYYSAIEIASKSEIGNFSFTGYASDNAKLRIVCEGIPNKYALVGLDPLPNEISNNYYPEPGLDSKVYDFYTEINNVGPGSVVNVQNGLEISNIPQGMNSDGFDDNGNAPGARLTFTTSGGTPNQATKAPGNYGDYKWQFISLPKFKQQNGSAPSDPFNSNAFELWEYPSNDASGVGCCRARLQLMSSTDQNAAPSPVVIGQDGSMSIGYNKGDNIPVDCKLGVNGNAIVNNLTLMDFKGTSGKGKVLTVDDDGKIAAINAIGNAFSFKEVTKDNGGWFKMGTLNIPQGGYNAMIKMYAGSRFNAYLNQNGYLELFIRSSNSNGGNKVSATAIRYGQNSFIKEIEIRNALNKNQQPTNDFEIYVYADEYIGSGFYTVEGMNVSWEEDCSGILSSFVPNNNNSVPFELRTRDAVFIGDCSAHPVDPEIKLDVAGKTSTSSLVVKEFEGDIAKGKVLTVDEKGKIALSNAIGNAYSFKDVTKGGGGWFKLGTIKILQGGYNAMIKLYAGSSYTGSLDQNGYVELFIRSSNLNVSSNNHGVVSATGTHYGQNAFISQIKILDNTSDLNKYDVYVKAGIYIGNGYYTVDGLNTLWVEDCEPQISLDATILASLNGINIPSVPFELRTRDAVFIGDCSAHPVDPDIKLDVAGKTSTSSLVVKEFEGDIAKGKVLTVDEKGKITLSKSIGNVYSFKDATKEGVQVGWFKLGSLTILQKGYNATIKMYAGSGFNAIAYQNGSVELFIRTSNGNNNNDNNITATATHFGQNRFIEEISIKLDNANFNSYDIYVKADKYIGTGYYTVDGYNIEWVEDCGIASQTPPTGNAFNVPFEFRTQDKMYIGDCSSHTGDYQLDVAGKIRADKLTVNTTGADFVFDSGYHLPTLSQVEKFVQKEHRLPGIASAKDMQANGLDLGENQTLLLQKVEELTLYMIAQEKKMVALQAEIRQLKAGRKPRKGGD